MRIDQYIEINQHLSFSYKIFEDIIIEKGVLELSLIKSQIGDFPKDSINRGEYFVESFALYNMNLYTNLSNRVIHGMFHTLEGL